MIHVLLKKIAESREGMRWHVARSTCQHSDKASSDFLRNPLGRGECIIIYSSEYKRDDRRAFIDVDAVRSVP